MAREPRWYRRLPDAAKNLPPDAYDHCAAVAEVMTPDAVLRDIACGKKRQGHGRWHLNGRKGVTWRGKWKRPTYMNEHIDNEVEAFAEKLQTDGAGDATP
jgi:hypothetical protein